jgi:hypothetical protein
MEGQSRRGGYYPSDPPLLQPSQAAIAEMARVRHKDMLSLSERLGRVQRESRATPYDKAATGSFWAAIGAVVAAIPLLGSAEDIELWSLLLYGVVIAMFFVVALICRLACRSITAERADSVKAIKGDLDGWIASYQEEAT